MSKQVMQRELCKLFGAMAMAGYDLSNVAVCGGVLRDHKLRPDVMPKDVDVCITGDRRGIAVLPEGWSVLHEFDSQYDGEVVSEDFDKRIAHVTKLVYKWDYPVPGKFMEWEKREFTVDLIYALPRFAYPTDFVLEFDFNINQWLLPAERIFHGFDSTEYLGGVSGYLEETRGTEVHPHRRLRMIEMARDLGWCINDFEGELTKCQHPDFVTCKHCRQED